MAIQHAVAGRNRLSGLVPFALAWAVVLAFRTASAGEMTGAVRPASLPAAKDFSGPLVVLPRPDRVRSVEHAKAQHCNGRCGKGGCGQQGCPAYCPVRPDEFGYYGTRWRTWPGVGMVQQAGYNEAATPVSPPRSEVPSADEESPAVVEEPLPPEPEAPAAESQETLPGSEPLPPAKPAAAEPLPSEPAAEAPPALEQEQAPPARSDDNLFDEATLRKRRHERLVAIQQEAFLRERTRQEALRQQAAASRLPRPMPSHPLRPEPSPGVVRASHEQPAAGSNPLR